MQSDTQKLRVLRARTDHDLLALVQRELERGLIAARLATSKSSQLFAQAQKAYDTATRLLARAPRSSGDDRLGIESQLKELHNRLDAIPAFATARAYPSSFAS